MPKVSVVIPCFNHGHFVDDAVNSVLAQTFTDFEIIIVNDGSTDPETNRILKEYNRPQTVVLHTANSGRGAVRNNGIRVARGQYILPLDADDKIGPTYLAQAVELLDENENMGVVYCEAEFFGAQTGKWNLPAYKFPDILLRNVIFVSGVYRKSDWEKVGGYRGNFTVLEDYDFWLSIIELKRDVYRIPEVLFYYRQHEASFMPQHSMQQLFKPYAQVLRNHSQLVIDNMDFLAEHLLTLSDRAHRMEEKVAHMRRSKFWKVRESCYRVLAPLLGRSKE